MGPLRRGLIAVTATLAPGAAQAGICATQRPGWQPADGPVGAWGETLYILGSPLGLGIVLLLGIGLVFPRPWLSAILALPALGLAWLLTIGRTSDAAGLAMSEGCIGTAMPASILLVLMAAVVLVRGFRGRPRRKPAA